MVQKMGEIKFLNGICLESNLNGLSTQTAALGFVESKLRALLNLRKLSPGAFFWSLFQILIDFE